MQVRRKRTQTVVLPTSPDTLLGVECTFEFCHFRVWVYCAKKDGLELCKCKRDERLELIAEAPDSFLHLRTREWDLQRGLLVMKGHIRDFLSERK